jgi:hypothetical protein
LWGKTVMMRPDQYSVFSQDSLAAGPRPILGQLTVFDRFGQQAAVSITSFVTVQVWKT